MEFKIVKTVADLSCNYGITFSGLAVIIYIFEMPKFYKITCLRLHFFCSKVWPFGEMLLPSKKDYFKILKYIKDFSEILLS